MKNSEMYTEEIIELARSPQNFGKLENPTHQASVYNPLCGDELEISLQVADNCVKDVKFTASGCALSRVSASLLTERIKNRSIEEISEINEDEVLNLIEVPIRPARQKCISLALNALKKALQSSKQ